MFSPFGGRKTRLLSVRSKLLGAESVVVRPPLAEIVLLPELKAAKRHEWNP